MKSHLELLDQLRQALGAPRTPVTGAALARPVGALGAPPHLAPGRRVVDPVTGQEGEVLAYGRTYTLTPPA